MNLCYIGNSVSAQKNSYREWLSPLLFEGSTHKHLANCTLGGIGSLGISFFINRFVNEPVDICFVETFVADLGGVTPQEHIQPALQGIINNPKLKNAKIVPIYLYRSDVTTSQYNQLLKLYDDVFIPSGFQPINVFATIQEKITGNVLTPDVVVYDHIHTTIEGAKIYAEFIHEKLIQQQQSKLTHPAIATSINEIRPLPLQDIETMVRKGSFNRGIYRWTMRYIEISQGNSITVQLEHSDCIGLIVIADQETGVLEIDTKDWQQTVQIFDKWCTYSRLQTILFKQPLSAGSQMIIRASLNGLGTYTPDLHPSATIRVGKSIKIAHLMECKYYQ